MGTPARACAIAVVAFATGVATSPLATAEPPPPSPNGQSWSVTDFPSKFGGLNAVVDEGDATVAVGFGIAKGFRFTPVAATWDGDSWHNQPVRMHYPGAEVQLRDVDLSGDRSGWAVGSAFGDFGATPVAVRWNGSAWRATPTEDMTGQVGFAGVAIVGKRDVWAVGQKQVGDVLTPVIGHYGGAGWEPVKVPKLSDVGPNTDLQSITEDSNHDLFAVGEGGVALRYHQGSWAQVAVPKVGGEYLQLAKVRSLGDDGLWAVGYVSLDDGRHPVALHWDGSAWKTVSVPADALAQLNDVTSTASGVVAVGYSQNGPTAFYGLQLDPTGPSHALDLPTGGNVLYGVDSNDAGTELWIVGSGPGPGAKINPYAAVRS